MDIQSTFAMELIGPGLNGKGDKVLQMRKHIEDLRMSTEKKTGNPLLDSTIISVEEKPIKQPSSKKKKKKAALWSPTKEARDNMQGNFNFSKTFKKKTDDGLMIKLDKLFK